MEDHTFSNITSLSLLARAQRGDSVALEALMGRYRARLRRWAAGRLPNSQRPALDTDDLVQDVLLATLRNLSGFVPQHDGALMAYLRQAVANRILEVGRRRTGLRVDGELANEVASGEQTPLERLVGRERMARYEEALQLISDDDRVAIIGRFEMGYSYDALARATGRPSAEAARKAVEGAVRRLVALLTPDGR